MNKHLMFEVIFSFCFLMYDGFCFIIFALKAMRAASAIFRQAESWLPYFCSKGDILPYRL